MIRQIASALAVAVLSMAPLSAGEITGQYVEARTCDVWTGPCFANADFNLTGKNAVLAWKIETGALDNVRLDGLTVVAVISAHNTLGLDQKGPAQAVLIVDEKANSQQREALIRLAQTQGGQLVKHVNKVHAAPIKLDMCDCKGNVCAELDAGVARVKTRCLNAGHDKACGNETAYYPPLVQNVKAQVAGVVEHTFRGRGLGETWSDPERRGAYVGTFEIK